MEMILIRQFIQILSYCFIMYPGNMANISDNPRDFDMKYSIFHSITHQTCVYSYLVYFSPSALRRLNNRCYTGLRHSPIGQCLIGSWLIHIIVPYTSDWYYLTAACAESYQYRHTYLRSVTIIYSTCSIIKE